jgi:hypothetical protein
MTKGIAGRRQAPRAVTEMARRLEDVRERFGVPSLRAFHAQLDVGWKEGDGRVSYEAVRNYHYERDAPVAYLARVAEVFGVRLPYLVAGDGPMTEEEERAHAAEPPTSWSWPWEDVHVGVTGGFGEGADWVLGIDGDRVGARGAIIAKTARILSFSPAGKAMVPSHKSLGIRGAARVVGMALRGPLDALEIDPARPIPDDVYDDYVVNVCSALRRLVDHPNKEAPDGEEA